MALRIYGFGVNEVLVGFNTLPRLRDYIASPGFLLSAFFLDLACFLLQKNFYVLLYDDGVLPTGHEVRPMETAAAASACAAGAFQATWQKALAVPFNR